MASRLKSASSSPSSSQDRSASSRHAEPHIDDGSVDSVPVETLVQYLLDAKRSLSSMRLVLRANEVVHLSRQAHEESVILSSQTHFLRSGITDQIRLLTRMRRSMTRTYDSAKREFKHIIKTLDAANGTLEDTLKVLHNRTVDSAFRPEGEEKRSLADFIDESQVETMRNSLKETLGALQATQASYDGDLLRFDTELRTLNKTLSSAASHSSPANSSSERPLHETLMSLMTNSHAMAELLTSLTKHFDLCVTAVRTTEGGAALARIKAAEVTQSQGGAEDVSISGVMAEQESHMADVEPISPQDRAQMLEVVVQDANEVNDVVQELNERLQSMESEFASLDEQTNRVKLEYLSTLEAFRVLEDLGSRLQSYIDAESEFRQRWIEEHETIQDRMVEMDNLCAFYESYASSYDGLILEVERRKALEDKVMNIWRKAKESVDKLVDSDRREREAFRHEVAEFLPTDLWPGMDDGMRRWEVVPVREGTASSGIGTPTLERSVVQAAAMRHGRSSHER